jgi:hypothetical protein
MAEALEADDVMNVLPDDARYRHRAHETHDDDPFAFHARINRKERRGHRAI